MGNSLKDQLKQYAKEANEEEPVPRGFDILSREIESARHNDVLMKAIESQKLSNTKMKKKLK